MAIPSKEERERRVNVIRSFVEAWGGRRRPRVLPPRVVYDESPPRYNWYKPGDHHRVEEAYVETPEIIDSPNLRDYD
jgi:hypothetical protein